MRSPEDAKGLVVAVANNQPVYLRDVATVTDGAEEPASYVLFGYGDVAQEHGTKAAKKKRNLLNILVKLRL